jgi:Chaperone of endosialidase
MIAALKRLAQCGMGLALSAVVLWTSTAFAQFATPPGYSAGTTGAACSGSSINYAWPDANGNVLQCVSNVWTVVGQSIAAAGVTGDVQYNNAGALAGAANLFWNNGSGFLGIGTNVPGNALDANGGVAVGAYAGANTAPANGLIISGPTGIGTSSSLTNASIGGNLVIGSGFGTTMTTLNGAMTIGTTTMVVNSTANYPSSGELVVLNDLELINYTGKTATTFTGLTRGVYTTSASTHNSGNAVAAMLMRVWQDTSWGSSLMVTNNHSVMSSDVQYRQQLTIAENNLVNTLCIGTNCNGGISSFLVGNGAGAGAGYGKENNVLVIGGGYANGNNAQNLGAKSSNAYAGYVLFNNLATGSETWNTWSGTDPVFVIGIGTNGSNLANGLMVFQNGQMLVEGTTTVAVPAGTASLTAMGTSTATGAAALNATDSAGNSKLYVRNDGNVGIGTTSPANALDVNGGIAINNGVVIGSSYMGLTAPSAGLLVSGSLGIGSAAPFDTIDIAGNMIVADGIGAGTVHTGVGVGTTLTNGAITAGTTTIIVNSTANFPNSGMLAILNTYEDVLYTSKTATAFLNCTRGANGTGAGATGSGSQVAAILMNLVPSGGTGMFEVFSSQGIVMGSPQQIYPWGPSLEISGVGANNVGVNYNSLSIAECEGSNFPAGGEINSLSMSGGCVGAYGVNSVDFGYQKSTAAFAELIDGQYPKATGTENYKSWTGVDPVLLVGIGTSGASANALMVFQNGRMLVNGGTTVAVPAGTASLTTMGTSSTSNAAALNATNSSGTSLMLVRNDGDVGIGTSNPLKMLHVGSASASGIVAEFQNSSGACTLNPGASSMTTVCSSDIRLKTDIVDSTEAMPGIKTMRVRNFTIRATGERATGVIAQELIVSHPDMVHMTASGFYGVEAPNPWKLVKALQELEARRHALLSAIDEQKTAHDRKTAALVALRERLDTLEAAKR